MASNRQEISKFSKIIEAMVVEEKIDYMDAIVNYCERSGLEIEMAAKLISPAIKSKIQIEAQDQNMLKKSARLPI